MPTTGQLWPKPWSSAAPSLPGQAYDNFARADGVLAGSVSPCGLKWASSVPSAQIVGGRLVLNTGTGGWCSYVLVDSGNNQPTYNANVYELTFDFGRAAAASSFNMKACIAVPAGVGVVAAIGDSTVFLYTTTNDGASITYTNVSGSYTPLVAGGPLKKFTLRLDRTTNVVTALVDGTSIATYTLTGAQIPTGAMRFSTWCGNQNPAEDRIIDNYSYKVSGGSAPALGVVGQIHPRR